MSGVLAKIVASKEAEVRALGEGTGRARHRAGPRGGVERALRRGAGEPLRVIAEHKRKSPSAGPLSTALSPADRALAYARGGAAMISVLCDAPFFDGSWEQLLAIRDALDVAGLTTPLLAKEFVIAREQIVEAEACGADAVLVIARILDATRVAALCRAARELGLEPVVEVITDEELGWALDAGAVTIGVNARDLDTLVMDADRAARVLDAIPARCIPLYLSGLKGPDDVRRVAATKAHAALVGETLMREDDPTPLLASMIAASKR
ncbi:MAG: indole-3-glycerol-phosphate synthase [Labilithrix sp.]|nr:indole-3-glycerol-phosphate synthase [Labilithrix sp.]